MVRWSRRAGSHFCSVFWKSQVQISARSFRQYGSYATDWTTEESGIDSRNIFSLLGSVPGIKNIQVTTIRVFIVNYMINLVSWKWIEFIDWYTNCSVKKSTYFVGVTNVVTSAHNCCRSYCSRWWKIPTRTYVASNHFPRNILVRKHVTFFGNVRGKIRVAPWAGRMRILSNGRLL